MYPRHQTQHKLKIMHKTFRHPIIVKKQKHYKRWLAKKNKSMIIYLLLHLLRFVFACVRGPVKHGPEKENKR